MEGDSDNTEHGSVKAHERWQVRHLGGLPGGDGAGQRVLLVPRVSLK
jgi:hypothetical protein